MDYLCLWSVSLLTATARPCSRRPRWTKCRCRWGQIRFGDAILDLSSAEIARGSVRQRLPECKPVRRLLKDGRVGLKPDEAHTALVGEVKFVGLGDQVSAMTEVRRHAKHLEEQQTPTRLVSPESQANQVTVTIVAGARYAHSLKPRFCIV
jgi:hypothetical protein